VSGVSSASDRTFGDDEKGAKGGISQGFVP
jgi:hypothetical protein